MSRLCVSDLMHPCRAGSVRTTTTLRQAAEQLLTSGLESLPVVDHEGQMIGLVSQTAVIRELLNTACRRATVESIVSRHVESARSTASLDSVLPLFRTAAVTMIPVIDAQNQPVGLVHREDVIRYLLDGRPAADAASTQTGPHYLSQNRRTVER